MLSTFLPRDVADIRQRYAGDTLYAVISQACFACCEIPRACAFTPEQVYVEIMYYLDDLKQQQQDVAWQRLFRTIRQDYHLQGQNLPDEELDCIAATIVCALASIMAVAKPAFYHRDLAQMLMRQIYLPENKLPETQLDTLMDCIEAHDTEIQQWLTAYMESDRFISDDFIRYFVPGDTESQFISFAPAATNTQRAECTATLQRLINSKKSHGKAADIKALLRKYHDEGIIILLGTEADIFRELQSIYGLTVSRSAFFDAEPKLTRK